MGPEPKPDRPNYDQALKRLISRAHDGFLALVAPGLMFRGELSPELPSSARYADLAWEVEAHDGRRGTLHIELQTKPDADIGERVMEYGMRLWLRDHRPVRSLVVFLRPSETLPESPFIVPWLDGETLRCTFTTIRLWEKPPEQVLETPFYDLWPLAGLMAGATPETTISVAERIADIPLSRQERSELTSLLVLLAGIRFKGQTLLEALRRANMIEDLLKESSFGEVMYALVREEVEEQAEAKGLAQGMAEGLAQGIAEGRAEGRAEGMAEALREMARTAIEGRFGQVSEDMLGALATADEQTCKAIAAHISTDTLEQVRARLGLS